MVSMASPSRDEILQSLTAVIDPELRENIVELGMVRSIDIAESGACYELTVTHRGYDKSGAIVETARTSFSVNRP